MKECVATVPDASFAGISRLTVIPCGVRFRFIFLNQFLRKRLPAQDDAVVRVLMDVPDVSGG